MKHLERERGPKVFIVADGLPGPRKATAQQSMHAEKAQSGRWHWVPVSGKNSFIPSRHMSSLGADPDAKLDNMTAR